MYVSRHAAFRSRSATTHGRGVSRPATPRSDAAYDVVVDEPVRSYTREEFNARFAGMAPPTPDDVTILTDGRRLDTPAKVIAFVDWMNEHRDHLDEVDLADLVLPE